MMPPEEAVVITPRSGVRGRRTEADSQRDFGSPLMLDRDPGDGLAVPEWPASKDRRTPTKLSITVPVAVNLRLKMWYKVVEQSPAWLSRMARKCRTR